MNARLLSLSSAMSPITESAIPAVIQRANVVSGRPMTAKKSSVVSGLNAISSQRTRFSAPRIASVLVTQRAAIGQRRTDRLYLDSCGAARFVRAPYRQKLVPVPPKLSISKTSVTWLAESTATSQFQCPAMLTVRLAVDWFEGGRDKGGFLTAYAEPVKAGERIWYLTNESVGAPSADSSLRVLPKAALIGDGQPAGTYRVHAIFSRRPVAREALANLGADDTLARVDLDLVVPR
jgi:hypothetical protein